MRRSSMGSDTALVSVVCLGLLALIASSAGGGPAPVLGEQASAPGGGWVVLAGGHTAPGQFKSPSGVAVDGAGNLYVADSGNHRIQKLSPTGEPLAQWGTEGSAAGQFLNTGGVAVDGAGNLYVTSQGPSDEPGASLGIVQKVSPTGALLAQWSSEPRYSSGLGGVALDGEGNIYVSDTEYNRIQKLSPDAEPLAQWGGTEGEALRFYSPRGIAVDTRDNVYVVDSTRVQKLSPGGEPLAQWGTPGQFRDPRGIAVDSAGNLYVAEAGSCARGGCLGMRIQKLSSNGEPLAQWGSMGSGPGQFDRPRGVAVDGDGDIYIADLGNNRIQKLSATGEFLAQWGGQFDNTWSTAVDGQGNIYVAEGYLWGGKHSRIQKLSPDAEPLAQWGRTEGREPGQFASPRGIAVDGAGNVLVADTGNSRIQKLSPSGAPLAQWGSRGSEPGQFKGPSGVAVDGAGNLYVADSGNHRIQKLSPTGEPLAQWGTEGSAPGQFKGPSGVAVDGAGNLYVADSGNHRIQKLSPTGEPLAQWGTEGSAAGQFFQPGGVAVDSDGNIYVADGSLFGGPNSRIQQLSANGEPMAEWGTRGSAPGQFRAPQGIAVDGVGNIFVADTLNDRIQKLTAGRLPRTGGPPAEPPSGAIGLLGMALLATGAALGLFARFR